MTVSRRPRSPNLWTGLGDCRVMEDRAFSKFWGFVFNSLPLWIFYSQKPFHLLILLYVLREEQELSGNAGELTCSLVTDEFQLIFTYQYLNPARLLSTTDKT